MTNSAAHRNALADMDAWETGHVLDGEGVVHLAEEDSTACGVTDTWASTSEAVSCPECAPAPKVIRGDAVAAHLDVVADFDRIRPGMRVVFYHHASNQDQYATVVAWEPLYAVSAAGVLGCLSARAVLHVADMGLGNGFSAGEQIVRRVIGKFDSVLKMAYRQSVWPVRL